MFGLPSLRNLKVILLGVIIAFSILAIKDIIFPSTYKVLSYLLDKIIIIAVFVALYILFIYQKK